MFFRSLLVSIPLCLGLCFSAAAQNFLPTGQELRTRAEIDNFVTGHFMIRNFAALEAQAAQYRDANETTPSGLQKLNLFYFRLIDAVKRELGFHGAQEELLEVADDWVTAYPESPTAAIGKAVILKTIAWEHRGGGYARSVDPSAWEPFFEFSAMADNALLETKHYAAIDPHWYTLRASILKDLQSEPDIFAAHMEEGLDLYPGYYQLYFSAIDYLSPRWNGNPLMIENFANEMVARTRAVEGEGMYARIYWYAAQTIYGNDLFVGSDVRWESMRVGIWDVLDRYPDQWNIQNFAFFACLTQDATTLADLMAMMDGPPIMRVWKNDEVLAYCEDLAAPI